MGKPYLRIIGDVHGKYQKYKEIAEKSQYSIQVGDMGFDYQTLVDLDIDPKRHLFFSGNHDNMDIYHLSPHSMGNSGYSVGCTPVEHGHFGYTWIRGGFSIDKQYRIRNEVSGGLKTWWEEEELNYADGMNALKCYCNQKPDVMLSHSCPTEIAKLIGNPRALRCFGFNPETFKTSTQELLQQCFEVHKPRLWVFGHFHISRTVKVKGTTFVCLPELGYLDLDEHGEMKK